MDKVQRMDDLITPRLRLHPFTVEEARRIVAATPSESDRWAEQFPMQDDKDGVGGFLKAAEAGADAGPFGSYRIDDADGAAVGTIGFYGPPDEEGRVTIGYGLVPGARGAGYATEAVAGVIAFCRLREDVSAVLADTDRDNIPSQRVLTKNGFVFGREDEELFYYTLDVKAS
jgi:RimJ/RimL family protein N-acetyltransferase